MHLGKQINRTIILLAGEDYIVYKYLDNNFIVLEEAKYGRVHYYSKSYQANKLGGINSTNISAPIISHTPYGGKCAGWTPSPNAQYLLCTREFYSNHAYCYDKNRKTQVTIFAKIAKLIT